MFEKLLIICHTDLNQQRKNKFSWTHSCSILVFWVPIVCMFIMLSKKRVVHHFLQPKHQASPRDKYGHLKTRFLWNQSFTVKKITSFVNKEHVASTPEILPPTAFRETLAINSANKKTISKGKKAFVIWNRRKLKEIRSHHPWSLAVSHRSADKDSWVIAGNKCGRLKKCVPQTQIVQSMQSPSIHYPPYKRT